jgi:hypothetical protein
LQPVQHLNQGVTRSQSQVIGQIGQWLDFFRYPDKPIVVELRRRF